MWHVDNVTLLLLVLSHAESNLTATFTTLLKFPMGLWSRLFHLVGVVLGDFPATVVAMANKPEVEKSRHSIATPVRLTRVSTKARSWKKEYVLFLKSNKHWYVFSWIPLACVHHFFLFLLEWSKDKIIIIYY